MPYALQVGEDVTSGLRRIAGEQAKRGIASLQAGLEEDPATIDPEGEDPWDEAVHDARKRCKKVRAVARLCRDALGDAYPPINAAFRDAAALLSDARDAWTLVETVDWLAGEDDGLLAEDAADAVREVLLDRYRRVRAATAEEDRVRQALDALTAAAADVAAWPLPADLSPSDLRPSVRRVYKRGRKAWATCSQRLGEAPHDATEEWHELRKRVKYLWYHVRLLEEAWPEMLGGLESDLDDLADDLGDDHDLAVLVHTLRAEQLVGPGIAEQVAGAAAVQRQELHTSVAWLAPRLYVESPGAFADRLVAYAQLLADETLPGEE